MKKVLAFILITVMLISTVAFPVSADGEFKQDKAYIVLGPSGFENLGNWVVQKDHTTDYNILLGATNGIPSPETPATFDVCLLEAGTYKMHVLSKDFLTNPGTRYYDVSLGNVITQRFGDHCQDGFYWQSTDPFMSFGGDMTVSLSDVKGNCARCAAIVITNDLEFTPSADLEFVNSLLEKQYVKGQYTYSPHSVPENRPGDDIAVCLNGNWLQFDVAPVIINGRTMVPFRAIFEALGCVVTWDDETKTAGGRRNGTEISLPIGDTNVTVNRRVQTLDQPAMLLNSRTMVPLRFVSEALGAQVNWDGENKNVSILANIPSEMVLFTQDSYTDVGTWVMESNAEGAFNTSAMRGAVPSDINATLEDADTSNNKPAIAPFALNQGGTYRIWVRSKDFAQNQQGDRFFNLQFNNEPMLEHRYGTHGGTGYAWASGGTVELNEGQNIMYVHDTSGFYARYDAILLSKDLDYVPAENYQTVTQNVLPYNNIPNLNVQFPKYANEQNQPTDSIAIENAETKVVFYKVPTSNGQ
ncbi:MAG: copper amine oxidase N-terminal domain-containing protein, partial [Clostridia bacterium]|nr:copper amine oxidase N-terminal domain-containing protein [Clostridia bacterium]